MSNPVVDLTIQDLTTKGPKPLSGWSFLHQDLNPSVGGHYIYLGFKRGIGQAVTSLTFDSFKNSQQDNPKPGWNWNTTDLHRRAGGDYIYMFWRRGEAGKPPFKGLMIIPTNQSVPYSIGGWVRAGVDLNKGAGGLYIWVYYSTLIDFP